MRRSLPRCFVTGSSRSSRKGELSRVFGGHLVMLARMAKGLSPTWLRTASAFKSPENQDSDTFEDHLVLLPSSFGRSFLIEDRGRGAKIGPSEEAK